MYFIVGVVFFYYGKWCFKGGFIVEGVVREDWYINFVIFVVVDIWCGYDRCGKVVDFDLLLIGIECVYVVLVKYLLGVGKFISVCIEWNLGIILKSSCYIVEGIIEFYYFKNSIDIRVVCDCW